MIDDLAGDDETLKSGLDDALELWMDGTFDDADYRREVLVRCYVCVCLCVCVCMQAGIVD